MQSLKLKHHWICIPMVFFYVVGFAQPNWDLQLLDRMNSAPKRGDGVMHGFSNCVSYVMLATPVVSGGIAWKTKKEAALDIRACIWEFIIRQTCWPEHGLVVVVPC